MGEAKTQPDLLTPAEAAPLLRLHPKRVCRLIADGHLRAKRRGRRLLIPRSAVRAYLDALPDAGEKVSVEPGVPKAGRRRKALAGVVEIV